MLLAQTDLAGGFAISAIVLFGLFVKKLIDTLRFAAAMARGEAGAKSSLITQLIAFGAGLVSVFLFAASDFANMAVAGVHLGDADAATKVILGLLVASLGGTVTDVIKGVDSSQSAAMPRIVQDRPPTP